MYASHLSNTVYMGNEGHNLVVVSYFGGVNKKLLKDKKNYNKISYGKNAMKG